MRRDNIICVADYWDSKNFDKYNYYLQLVNYYPVIQGSEDCVLNVFFHSFFQAKIAIENSGILISFTLLFYLI